MLENFCVTCELKSPHFIQSNGGNLFVICDYTDSCAQFVNGGIDYPLTNRFIHTKSPIGDYTTMAIQSSLDIGEVNAEDEFRTSMLSESILREESDMNQLISNSFFCPDYDHHCDNEDCLAIQVITSRLERESVHSMIESLRELP
jgi:hypothetical protein